MKTPTCKKCGADHWNRQPCRPARQPHFVINRESEPAKTFHSQTASSFRATGGFTPRPFVGAESARS